jgi:hypothetical protein
MGKVYVLRKDASASAGAAPAITNQGVGIVMNTSPEKVNYAKYGAGVDDKGKPYGGSAGQEKWARRIGNMGGKARVGCWCSKWVEFPLQCHIQWTARCSIGSWSRCHVRLLRLAGA